jgi:hypothetical protein
MWDREKRRGLRAASFGLSTAHVAGSTIEPAVVRPFSAFDACALREAATLLLAKC